MLRTHNCGELRINDIGKTVTLCGWVHKNRNLGALTFVDLRDFFGITQLIFDMNKDKYLCEKARNLGREYVIQVKGIVRERSNKNKNIPTGDIEIDVKEINILNKSKTPPFTIEDKTDGGEELRMQYRYLDLRRKPLQNNILLRHKIASAVREYLNKKNFIEIETPFLIKSTPEGARDFIVPSRIHKGQFYALPQSPQTFKQILMIAGYDRYYQIVRCFRDEDLRADRQPEFTQIDCEMSFVTQEDIREVFGGLIIYLFDKIKGIKISNIPVITYEDAMKYYGTDKPDTRFDMKFHNLNNILKNKNFKIFDNSEIILGINVKNASSLSRKEIDKITDFVKKPQIGAKGLFYIKYNNDDTIKSSIEKFFNESVLRKVIKTMNSSQGDLILILAGEKKQTNYAMSELRLEMAKKMNLIDNNLFKPLWVTDFPLLEWDNETKRWYAKHHPFTSPKEEDFHLIDEQCEKVRANAYDLVINGIEIGGGSIRIHKREIQEKIFKILGLSKKEVIKQFNFLIEALEYGAPPHGGIAFGFDRLCALLAGTNSIRDIIAFPKNNAARDTMINAPSEISTEQLNELNLKLI